ncbi:MAG: Hsp70 family protein, partial [Kofleriaceae bacterium]
MRFAAPPRHPSRARGGDLRRDAFVPGRLPDDHRAHDLRDRGLGRPGPAGAVLHPPPRGRAPPTIQEVHPPGDGPPVPVFAPPPRRGVFSLSVRDGSVRRVDPRGRGGVWARTSAVRGVPRARGEPVHGAVVRMDVAVPARGRALVRRRARHVAGRGGQLMSDPIVGIDLGTTNSVVAVCDASGQPRVLTDQRGTKIHPSVVSFHPNGSVIVGVDAKQRRVIDPRNTVYSAKRLIGRLWKSKEIQAAIGRMPYTIKEGANQQPVLVTRGGEFAVPEISAIVLDHVRNIAKQALGQEISRAVVTVPASFTDAQRSATATAGAIAGITVVRVLNEPTAAALAYGHQRQLSRTIAVYDFGGGTFDVTILRLQDQVYEVLATAGDSFLGGDDIDEVLMNHMADQFLASHRIDVRDNEVGVMRLRAVAEQTKIELSRRTRAIVKVDEIAYGPGGAPLNLEVEITRDQLVERAAPFFDKSFAVCEEALRLAQLSPAQIEDVVLVGGTTKIPHVRERVTRFFQRPPRTDVNPEEAVAVGAALQASALER